jgi:hypothetical protein
VAYRRYFANWLGDSGGVARLMVPIWKRRDWYTATSAFRFPGRTRTYSPSVNSCGGQFYYWLLQLSADD